MTAPRPPEFLRLCDRAAAAFESLRTGGGADRDARLSAARDALAAVDAAVAELDLRDPAYPEEQGRLTDAASALQAIALDLGGPHVDRWVDRAVADLRRLRGA